MSDPESVARAALTGVTPIETVGPLLGTVDEGEGVTTLRFAADVSGYPGWSWSVSLAQLPDEPPTVLETELRPDDGALLAPDWVPWAERLEEYRAAQAAAAAEADGAEDVDGSDDESDDDDHDVDAHDDLGDDPDDGIDFESDDDDLAGVALRGDDEQHEAETESDDDGPQQPDEA